MRSWIFVSLLGCTLALQNAQAISSEAATKAVTAAYEDVLGRKPDDEGMRLYRSKMVDHNWSEKDVRKALKASNEAKSENVDEIITRAYQDILGRDPDKEGMKTYRKKMTEEGMTEKRLREILRKSKEAKD